MGVGEYARVTIPHGTVAIYFDPHEICNVLGLPGVKAMLDDAHRVPLKAMLTTPSCVPAVIGFEDSGVAIGPEEVAESMMWPDTVGLGEMMDFPGVLGGVPRDTGEIAATLAADKVVTGHYSIPETGAGLNAYVASGTSSCHESTRPEDLLAKMRLGMYGMIREGSAWHDLHDLAPIITAGDVDTRFALLVSDDNHPHTLVGQGHIDHLIRRAVEEGIDPITAIQMVTINCATCFRMEHELGSIAPGKCADIVFLDDLCGLHVTCTIIDGEVVAQDGHITFELPLFTYPDWATHTMHVRDAITPASFSIPLSIADTSTARVRDNVAEARVIEVISGRVGDYERHLGLPVVDGCIEGDVEQDALKTFVFERHHETGTVGKGFVKGFGIKRGAMAQTVAHDAHNLLVIGSNDEDMALAANTLVACGGGMCAVQDGVVLGVVPLPIAGLMSDKGAHEVADQVVVLETAWTKLGCTMPSPFMTMGLVALACLPELRLTNRGLVDCTTFEFVPLLVEGES
jgi:adenine deaminase